MRVCFTSIGQPSALYINNVRDTAQVISSHGLPFLAYHNLSRSREDDLGCVPMEQMVLPLFSKGFCCTHYYIRNSIHNGGWKLNYWPRAVQMPWRRGAQGRLCQIWRYESCGAGSDVEISGTEIWYHATIYIYVLNKYIYIYMYVYMYMSLCVYIYIYLFIFYFIIFLFFASVVLKLYSTIWVAWWYPNHGFARQTIGWRTLERSPGNQKAHGYDIVMTHLGSQKSDSLVFGIKTVLELSTFLRCFGRYHWFLAMSK